MLGRIAVVDDDEGVLTYLTMLLEDRGYEVVPFSSATEATSALSERAPDLLIVDVRLKDGCGLDIIGKVRTDTGRRVPAIVLSGMKEERDFVRGFAAGAVDYLAKPFQKEELLARCAVHLARSSAFDVPDAAEVDLPEKDGLAFGRYKVEREIGRGGYGRVYLARDMQRNGSRVALKVLAALAGEQEEARLRFIRETYALASVQHRSIVPIHDVGCVQGRLYYAMEHVAGETLARRINRQGSLCERDVARIAKGLLPALAALDDAGILHRDLKPENVMLREGSIDDPVLIDFGLARRQIDRGITNDKVLVGTIGYLAPEVIRGESPDRRSDLFSLGLMLRAALCGEEVFPALQGIELLQEIARGPIPLPPVPLSDAFARFLEALCDVEPARRPPSARAALAAVEAAIDSAREDARTGKVPTIRRDGRTEVARVVSVRDAG